MTTTQSSPSSQPDHRALVLIQATYPGGSESRYVVPAEDVDSELSFYYSLADVTTTPLTPEQAVEVSPIVDKLAELTALIEAQPAPYVCTAKDRAIVAGYMVETDTAMMELDILLASFGITAADHESTRAEQAMC